MMPFVGTPNPADFERTIKPVFNLGRIAGSRVVNIAQIVIFSLTSIRN
jgi:hypothetical protein